VTYTIYGDLRSGAFSAEAALAEAGAAYTFERISLRTNEQKAPAFLALNPAGKVPALRLPEGHIVTESAAILLVVADRFPAAGLLPPSGSVARADAYRWIAFMASEIYPMVEIDDYPARFAPEGPEAEALRERAQARTRERLLVVDNAIAGPWLLGSGFSAADIYAVMFSRWNDTLGRGWAKENLPKINALAVEVSKRERIAPVWARHFGKG
jgi:GST-like protein